MKKESYYDDENKKKAAADAFQSDAKGLMPPSPIQLKKDNSTEDVVKTSISAVKEVKDYAEYGDVVLKNVNYLGDKSILRQGGEGILKKKLGGEVKGGDPFGKAGKAIDYGEIGIDLYDMSDAAKNKNRGKAFKAGTDALVKTIGLLGPYGAAFSTGYEIGGILNEQTGASDVVYNSLGLKEQAANNSFEAKTWNLESTKKEQLISMEKKAQFQSLLALVTSLENSKESIIGSLGKILTCYPNKHEIPEMPFMVSKPKVENIKSYTTVRTQTLEMMRLIPELKKYKQALLNYIATLTRLVKIAAKESKKFNLGDKTHFKETASEKEKDYTKYNDDGNVLEEGKVIVNRKGKIVGGTEIAYKEYNEDGHLLEEGTFDYNSKGKKVNQKGNKLIIY
jgi:hypothetical protein